MSRIRKALTGDIKRLNEIENELFSLEEGRISYRAFKYHISKGNKIFIITNEKEISGYILLFNYLKSVRIYSLGICVKAQGKGLGEILCTYGINVGRKNGKSYISLEVRSKNQKAIALYEKLGFKVEKVLPYYYINEDGLRMKKEL